MKSFSKFIEESKIVDDIISEGAFTKSHIDALKSAYGGIKKIDPDSPSYKKLTKMLDNMTDEQLKSLAKADINFVSALARNRVMKRGIKEENLDELSRKTLDSYMKKARKDMRDRYYDDSEENDKKFFQRSKGIETALNKKWSKNEAYAVTHKGQPFAYFDTEAEAKKHMEKYTKKGGASDYKVIKEAKGSGYTINHKTFSSAVQHAKDQVEKQGYQIDGDEWDRKVAMGPKKPSAGKTNTYTIDLMKAGKETKRKLQMQVYYDEGRYELNMYIS